MEGSAFIGGTIAGLCYFVAGISLIRLSWRSQRPADLFIGMSFLLWGVSGALWVLLELVIFPQEIGYEATQEFSATLGILSGSLEVVPVALIWIAFFPPAFYRNWVERGATAPE